MNDIPGNNPPPVCAICERWERTPFFSRHTTPTTVQDTEAALVLGYWISSRKPEDVVFRLCEKHSTYLFQLDVIEEARAAQAKAAQQSEADNARQAAFQQRALHITNKLAPQAVVLPPPLAPLLGVTTQLANEAAQAQLLASQPPAPEAQPEGGGEPPSLPAKIFPCPICGKQVKSGEVHYC